MIEFFPPILEHFCPLFIHIAQMDLILPKQVLIMPRIPLSTPVLYSLVTHPFWGYKTPPTPPQNSTFPRLNLKVGKINHSLGNLDSGPQMGKMFEKWTKLF